MVSYPIQKQETLSLTFLNVDLKSKENAPSPRSGEVPMEVGI
jgi:hypothetical protein